MVLDFDELETLKMAHKEGTAVLPMVPEKLDPEVLVLISFDHLIYKQGCTIVVMQLSLLSILVEESC